MINHSACPPEVGGDFALWMEDLEVLAGRQNVFVKTSDLSLGDDAGNRKHILGMLLDVFGAHRVMWGSGWPLLRPERSYKEALEDVQEALADVPIEAQASIFGGTARQVYRL